MLWGFRTPTRSMSLRVLLPDSSPRKPNLHQSSNALYVTNVRFVLR